MGVLTSILRSYDDIEEAIEFFIFDNTSIVFAEFTSDLLQDATMKWVKLRPNEARMQSLILTDYLHLTTWCSLILKNVESRNVRTFEQSASNVLSYIEQDTILMFTTLKDIFADIRSELDVQRHIIAQPYRDTLLRRQIG